MDTSDDECELCEECDRCGETFCKDNGDYWGSCHGYYECEDCWENHKDHCTRKDCGFREDDYDEEKEDLKDDEKKN